MSAPVLSQGLAALIAEMKPHEVAGRFLSPREVRLMVAVLDVQATQARLLEAEARELVEVRALARDLETAACAARGGPSLDGMRAAVAKGADRIEGSNVTVFPIVPRPRPREDDGGGA